MEDLNSLDLVQIIDKNTLQSLQDSFCEATGLAALCVNLKESITKWSNLTDFGAMFMKRMPEEHVKLATKAAEEAKRTGKPVIYETYLCFTECIIPIILHGNYIGHFVGGQVLTSKPSDSEIHHFATAHKWDNAELTAAIDKLEVASMTRVRAAAELLTQLAGNLAETCLKRYASSIRGKEARESLKNAGGAEAKLVSKVDETVQIVNDTKKSCESIKSNLMDSTKSIDNTDAIVKTIQNASTQLTLIGFNASIEAKRAGAAGAGFNVIAQEVRTLAEKNTKQATEIERTLNGIKRSMGDINGQIRGLYEEIEGIVDSINELTAEVTEIEKSKSEE